MANSRYILAAALALTIPVTAARAAEPEVRLKDAVLVLKNERTLHGDEIERREGRYCIRRATGETEVPEDRVLFLARNLEEAYQFLRNRANQNDLDERLRLIRWCKDHELRALALAEATAALAQWPKNAECQRLVRGLQAPPAAAAVAPPPRPEVAGAALPAVDVSPEALNQFCRRVQPILMNACARCHASGRGGAFQLTWNNDTSLANRKGTLQNLAAVLAQVSRERPAASPLLVKAITAHGNCPQPPLQGRTIAAYRTLEDWVRQAAESLPAEPVPALVAAAPVPEPVATPIEPEPPLPQAPQAFAAPAAEEEPAIPDPPAAPAVPAGPLDEFDPVIFNRQMHPQRME